MCDHTDYSLWQFYFVISFFSSKCSCHNDNIINWKLNENAISEHFLIIIIILNTMSMTHSLMWALKEIYFSKLISNRKFHFDLGATRKGYASWKTSYEGSGTILPNRFSLS